MHAQIRLLFLFFSLLIHTTINAQNSIDWKSDLVFIANELPQKHLNLFAKKDKEDFTSEIEKIAKEIENNSDLEIALRIQQVLASMGDSHTSLDYRILLSKEQNLPLQLYYFKDGLYVLCTSKNNTELVGGKILSVNKIPLQEVEQRISSLLVVDNQAILKKDIPQYLPTIQILKFLDIVSSDKINLEYQSQKGEIRHITLQTTLTNKSKACVQPQYKPSELALCYKNQKQWFTSDYIDKYKLLYLQYNRCWSKELETKYGNKQKAEKLASFNEYKNVVFTQINEQQIDKLIFDLRANSGGNSLQGTQFISELVEYLKDKTDIKVYVILGRQTFSSAILNALDFKKMFPNTIFAGEQTAGKPNHFGELKTLQLPGSKLNLSYSTKYFKRVDEDINSLVPDIEIESTFSDFIKGKDPVYEWITNN